MSGQFGHDIQQRTFINVPPEKVYDTITSGDGWNAFFTHSTEIDPRPGGEMWFRWKDWGPDKYTNNSKCKVRKTDRPTLFEFEWYPAGGEITTVIRFQLEPSDGGTIVTVTESGYTDSDRARAAILSCASGWGEAVTLLKFWLEHGVRY